MRVFKIDKDLELFLGSLGAIHSLFLTACLFFNKKRNIQSLLLSLFFFFISLRILKSVLWVYLDALPNWFLNFGFLAHLATGPILYLYIFYFISDRKWKPIDLCHFIPAFGLLLFLFNLNEDNFWYRGGYALLLYHQMIYTLMTIAVVAIRFRGKKQHNPLLSLQAQTWLGLLVIGASTIQMAYFSNYILGLTPYLAGPVVYAVFVYAISWYAITHQGIYQSHKSKYENIRLNKEELHSAKDRIRDIMDKQKPYLQDSLNLKELSAELGLPLYLTSYVINQGFQTNFPDFINGYRIGEAQRKLGNPAYTHIKISEVAYECGFNSLSSFNAAFKKHTGTTPSSFRQLLG